MSEIVKSSFGPNGMNKLVVNALDKIFVTSDTGTILRELEVQHPAARLILMASQQQDKELGDGTNLVVMLAGELLANAEDLLRLGLAPSVIVEGYELAHTKAQDILKEMLGEEQQSSISHQQLLPVVKSVLASKQYGLQDRLAELVVNACLAVKGTSAQSFNADSVRCVKIMGGSMEDAHVINGMVLGRQPESRLRYASKAKVAVYACPLNITRTETKGTVLLHSAQEMLDFGKAEEAAIEAQFKAIADSGVTVLITGDTIGETALHFIDRLGLVALKVPSKFDLRRLCKAIGANPLARLGAPTEEEAGWVDHLETVEIGGDWVTVLRQDATAARDICRLATIVLRGNSSGSLDDLERAVEDGVHAARTFCSKDSRTFAGAGGWEIEMARRLTVEAERTPGIVQYAMKKYAEAFEVVPRVLAMNAGFDSTEALAKLYWAHEKGHLHAGIDVEDESKMVLEDARPVAVDLAAVKASAMYLATDAALTVLRVDQIIMSKPAGGPKPPTPGPMDGGDD